MLILLYRIQQVLYFILWHLVIFFIDSGRLEQQLEEASSARQELEEAARQIKTFEKQIKALKQEKDELNKVMYISSVLFQNNCIYFSYRTFWLRWEQF